MSRRPTTIAQRSCSTTVADAYVIIGDTAAATLYARRLLSNGVTIPIYILSERADKLHIGDVTDISFSVDNNKRILHYLTTEQIHMIPSTTTEETLNFQIERVIQYHVGAGILGDFIAAYHIPRLGPWFITSSNNRLERFLMTSTVKSPLNSQENVIVDRLASIWQLSRTSSVIVKTPSILNVHYNFIQLQGDTLVREIFLDQYHTTNQSNNVTYVSETGNIQFTASSQGLHNITSDKVNVNQAKVVWKTNPYSYLRIATLGGLSPAQLQVPTFYRAVLTITISGVGNISETGCTQTSSSSSGFVCYRCDNGVSWCSPALTNTSGIDLSPLQPDSDLITTHVAFSLHDIANSKSSGLAWLVQAYTTHEDLSVVHPDGKYADSGHVLLIVEGVSTKNRRRTSYNTADKQVQIHYNNVATSDSYLKQFATIVSSIYNSYTGRLLSPSTIIAETSICTSGACQDSNVVVDYSLRQSPMVTILELASTLYGVDIYPNPC